MPLGKYFWKMRKMMMIGTAASAAPAMSRPKSVLFSACSFAMTREMVRLLAVSYTHLDVYKRQAYGDQRPQYPERVCEISGPQAERERSKPM